jgi:hypothetical protein
MADQSDKDTPNADPRKARRAAEGNGAVAAYEAEAAALRAKSERLRALRLARDAAAPSRPPKAAAAPRKKAERKAPAAKLSDWLADQEKSGRRT